MRSQSRFPTNAIGLALVWACACSAEPSKENIGSTPEQVLNSTSASSTHPESVRLQFEIGITIGRGSAVLVAPTLAVTALREVVKGFSDGNSESLLGSGAVCAIVGATYDPAQITVDLTDGTTRQVVRVITNGQSNTCQGGIAFLILDSPVQGVTFPQLQLDQMPNANDPVTACGWGDTDVNCTIPTGPSCATGSVMLANGGYYAADQDTFPTGYVLSSVSTCTADNGGGFFDKSGALFAIADKFFQPDKTKAPTINSPCAECDGDVTSGILISGQTDFIAGAFAAVGASPWRVGHPKPADVGATCTDALDCSSQLCVGVGSASYCSQTCSTTAACPASTVCTPIASQSICLPQEMPQPASCTVGHTPLNTSEKKQDPTGNGSIFALVAVAVSTLRRKSSMR